VKNLATREIKALAGKYSLRAVRQVWKLASEAKNPETRLKALELLLAYAHGKPSQTQLVGGTGDPIRTEALTSSSLGRDGELARRVGLLLGKAPQEPVEPPTDGRGIQYSNGSNGTRRTPDGAGESPDDKFEVGLVLDLPEKAKATLIATDRAGIGDWRVTKADGIEVMLLPGITKGEVMEWADFAAPKGRLS
jgi:hypothetical protein